MLTAEDLLLLTDDETGGGPAGPTLLEEVAHLLRWAVGCRATRLRRTTRDEPRRGRRWTQT
jgi:hypothetical protein